MFENIKKIFLSTNLDKKTFLFNFLGMLIIAFLEIISIGVVFPFLTLLTQEQEILIQKYPLLQSFNIQNLDFDIFFYISISILIIVFLLKNIFIAFFNYFQKKFFIGIQKKNSIKAINYYLQFNIKDRIDSPHILRNMGYIGEIFGWLSISFGLIIETVILFSITLFLLFISFESTLIVIFFALVIGMTFKIFLKKKISGWGEENNILIKKNYRHLINIIYGLREIVVFNKENYFSKLYSKSYDKMMSINFKMKVIEFLPRIFFEVLFIIILSFFLLYMFNKFKDFDLIIPYIGVYFVASMKIIPSISKIIMMTNGLRYSSHQISGLYEENLKINELKNLDDNLEITSEIKEINQIDFRNISFGYNKMKIMKDANFKLKKSLFYGLSGKSGSGKTTFLNILLRLIQPLEGEILVDDINIKKYSIKSWRKLIGIVPQEVFVLNDTIENNIAFGEIDEEINHEKILQAVKQAELDEFIAEQSSGLKTMLDENATNISGGQKQRIGIARALYRDPKILILDEPTNSLDHNTAKNFVETLEKIKSQRIIILATHDLDNLKRCDKIINIKERNIKII
jgi:ABC-type multidrug transport system fused ATPase/permease subunit